MKKKVLIVDDDKEFTWALSKRLRGIGLRVATASNTLTAMSMVRKEKPQLICLDVEMPTGDGLGVCEYLAADPAAGKAPVIMCTGRKDHATVRRCNELGAHYLHKSPDLWHNLHHLVCELLEHSTEANLPDTGA